MKKRHLYGAVLLTLAAAIPMTSCIGSFTLTKKVMAWNNQVGNKFLNEVVFVAFWILPVYEVSSIADLLVLNSIEFWSGRSPMIASTKKIQTDNGTFVIARDEKGYTITNELLGESVRLDYADDAQTWSVVTDEQTIPFMTFVDTNHVDMITPDGSFRTIELNEAGLTAYRQVAAQSNMAAK